MNDMLRLLPVVLKTAFWAGVERFIERFGPAVVVAVPLFTVVTNVLFCPQALSVELVQ